MRAREVWLKFLSDVLSETAVKIAAAIVVAALAAAGGYFVGYGQAEAKNEFRVRSAALDYAEELKKLIVEAERTIGSPAALSANPDSVRVYARSIIKVRDDLRSSLLLLSAQLNSELDRLSALLDQYEKEPTDATAREIVVTIRVLYQTWPSRQLKIDYAVRKIMIDLGLERIYFRDRES